MEVSGTVKKIFDTQTFGSGFRKRELILTTNEQYPQHLSIECVQEKTDFLNDLKPGDEIRVSINLRGREWTNPEGVTKYFNSIQGWRIEKIQSQTLGSESVPSASSPMSDAPVQFSNESTTSSTEEFDDLPF
ncbi:MAG: DUF3127 domain-containing protein [Flavobacteriales bacterium AspAUS03]